ncbi:MAG: von Willebrand factor type [Verrucomicrobia bacterium]|nr:von Willebrand factor type [Verrucomicrobiota bacterium]
MSFASPQIFWLLLVPLALLVAEFLRRRGAAAASHPKILHAEAGANGLALAERRRAPRRARPWLCVGLMLVIAALARPQWGRIEEPVFDQAREILIAIDLSRSMLAEDIKPSRLDRAKLLTQSLLEKLAGERVGLVTFSGTAFLQSPLSSDYEILREFLPALNPGFLPEGGTNYRALLETAMSAFGSTAAADRFLIILSDGEATDDNWKALIPDLKKKGIRVIGLGVGTTRGAMIPDGAGAFVKDERGAVVMSRLESNTLQDLSQETNGVYRDASTWIDLASILSSTVETGQKGKFVEKNTVRLVERFQWPLAFGLWCLLVSFYFEFPVRPRPRELKLRDKPEEAKLPPPLPKSVTTAALAALLLLSAIRNPQSATAATAAPAPSPLGKIVSRLSAQDIRTARDWAEMARETITWGHNLQSESRPVPAGPVRDALAASELGAALDPKTADWPKLTQELEALLKTPEDQKQDQKPPDKQDDQQKNQDQKDQKQDQKQEQKQDQQKQDQSQQNQQSQPKDQDKSQQDQQQQQQNSSEQNRPKPSQGKEGESAFGNMQEREKLPPPARDTQKVGGAPEKKDDEKKNTDPTLALPLQKLEQLRNQDSPAQLFQLMETDKKTPNQPKPKGKDW